jgi:hypothetical protein
MRDVTEPEKQRLWEEVRREFPEDEMMQEVHYVRLLHHLQTAGMSSRELAAFYQAACRTQDDG